MAVCVVCGMIYPTYYVSARGICADCREYGECPDAPRGLHEYIPSAYASPSAREAWARFMVMWAQKEAQQGLSLGDFMREGLRARPWVVAPIG